MTVVLDKDTAEKTVEVRATKPADHFASWLARAGAFAVDVVFGVALIATMAVLQAATPQYGVLWWYYVGIAVLAVILVVVNRLVLPSVWGWSLGRALFGIAVVRAATEDSDKPAGRIRRNAGRLAAVFGAVLVVAAAALAVLLRVGTLQVPGIPWWVFAAIAGVLVLVGVVVRFVLPRVRDSDVSPRDGVGPGRLIAREFAHLLDTLAVFVGWLWPLWDSHKRTFADLLVRTEVHRVRGSAAVRAKARRLTAIAVLVVGALCATGAGLNYLVVYRYESAVDAARADIAQQGPELVEQILSYGADTRGEDFARAQTLVTDSYRPQLVEQQLAVASSAPFTNEFWTVNSSVLSVTPDTASMLVMMQGRRATTNEDARFITATVKASFEKSDDGTWLISDVVVLTKPRPQLETGG